MLVPIRERCVLPAPPEMVFDAVASEEGFLLFQGFGPIPGLCEIVFDHGDFQRVGSTSRVTNTDGSTHREEIVVCDRPHRYGVTIHGLSSPFRFLVREIRETWRIEDDGRGGSEIERVFTFVLRSPIFWPVSVPLGHGLFRAAIRKNHRALAAKLRGDVPSTSSAPHTAGR